MRLFFDTVTGTYGDADDLRIVDNDDFGPDDIDAFGMMSDSELIEYGERWGVKVPPVSRKTPYMEREWVICTDAGVYDRFETEEEANAALPEYPGCYVAPAARRDFPF